MTKLQTIILAAGQGKRMKSPLPKILHSLGGAPLVAHAIWAAQGVRSQKTVLVVPAEFQHIREALEGFSKIEFAVQTQPLGTGHAVQAGLGKVSGSSGVVLVLNGDMPLIRESTIRELLKRHKKQKAAVSLLTAVLENPVGLGRVLRDARGSVTGIVEEKDASAAQKLVREINVGVYCFDLAFVRDALKRIKPNNAQKEYYLTDALRLALEAGKIVTALPLADVSEAFGVNSQSELARANLTFYQRQREEFMAAGVTLLGSEIFIDRGVSIQPGARIESPSYLKGTTKIGERVVIESGCSIRDTIIADQCQIKMSCYLDGASVGKMSSVGPFAHLRPGTKLHEHVRIGNFVETKKSDIRDHSKVNHLSYIGDATIGERVNVGAGTITCNYDGVNKFQTILDDDVFIGSDTQLVAPVRVGKGAVVGAGTTVTKNVPAGALALSRVRQFEISNWKSRKPKKRSK